jgi:septal ring-binding cell division protein DamX
MAAPAPATTSEPAIALSDLPPLTAQHAAQFDAWLPGAARENYFIQLTSRSAAHGDDIENFLARAGKSLDPAALRVYRSGPPENVQIGIIFGDYSSRATAWAAIRSLPEPIRRMRPYPRPVSTLQQ